MSKYPSMSLVSPGQSPRIVRFIRPGNSQAAQYLHAGRYSTPPQTFFLQLYNYGKD